MASFLIHGGTPLSGELFVSGSKNAVLPIICATILAKESCVLRNVPDIADVGHLLQILKEMGVEVDDTVSHQIIINTANIRTSTPHTELVKKFRGSILLLGPLLARFGEAHMPYPGGDLIGKRPIDTHVAALKALGASEVSDDIPRDHENQMLHMHMVRPQDAIVTMSELSVTATENAIMAAVCANGTVEIHLAAAEPHVQDLCIFLNAMGAQISGVGTHDLLIKGVSELHGAEHSIVPDNDVACSFLNLAAATRSELTIQKIRPEYLRAPLNKFREMNVNFTVGPDSITILKPTKAYIAPATKLEGMIYPGVGSDQIPPFAVLATQAEGTTLIHEHMYEGRLGYIHELAKMGAQAHIVDQHRAVITGPCKLRGMNVNSLDVRSGMVMVIAALVAEGKSVLHDIEHVDRGYEHLDVSLQNIGANITRA
jgi:UDP-N-acetylglucosamine 1-carboxyvinyltransferase